MNVFALCNAPAIQFLRTFNSISVQCECVIRYVFVIICVKAHSWSIRTRLTNSTCEFSKVTLAIGWLTYN